MQKTKLKVEGVVFLVNTIRDNMSREHDCKIIILAVGEIEELSESLREA